MTNVVRDIQHSAQVSDHAKDLKKRGKAIKGSVVVHDRRSDGSAVQPAQDSAESEGP